MEFLLCEILCGWLGHIATFLSGINYAQSFFKTNKGGRMTLPKLISFLMISLLSFGAKSQVEVLDHNILNHLDRDFIDCSSNDYKYETCYVRRHIVEARLISQFSRTDCIEGRTWGFYRDTLWVDNGCRGRFEVITREDYPSRSELVKCSSNDYRFDSCYPSSGQTIRFVVLERQESRTDCIEGRTWGYDRHRIWVDNGCRGIFRVHFR